MEYSRGKLHNHKLAIDIITTSEDGDSQHHDRLANMNETGTAYTSAFDRQEANAHRLTACWNAMEGIEEPEKAINEMRAQLETAERLALQGGAGHDAIVQKAVELRKQRDRLMEALADAQIIADKYTHCGDADKKCGTLSVISERAKAALALCDKEDGK